MTVVCNLEKFTGSPYQVFCKKPLYMKDYDFPGFQKDNVR